MLFEYCNEGNLFNYVQFRKRLSEEEAVCFMKQIIAGYQLFFHHTLLHRDIKCENIFLNNGVVKLGDFGFNRELKEGDYATTICGTIETMAPEVL